MCGTDLKGLLGKTGGLVEYGTVGEGYQVLRLCCRRMNLYPSPLK